MAGDWPVINVESVQKTYRQAQISRVRRAFAVLGGLDVNTRTQPLDADDDDDDDDDADVFGDGELVELTGVVQAVEEVSLQITGGGCIAILGPSGAGKSVLLRMIAGLTPPDAGRIVVEGLVAPLLPSVVPLLPKGVKLRRALMIFATYLRLPKALVRQSIGPAIDQLGDPTLGTRPVSVLGKRRNDPLFALLLSMNPDIVLLDMRLPYRPYGHVCRDRLLELKKDGALIVVTGSSDRDVAWIADRVIEMRDGRIVAERLIDAAASSQSAPDDDGRETVAEGE